MPDPAAFGSSQLKFPRRPALSNFAGPPDATNLVGSGTPLSGSGYRLEFSITFWPARENTIVPLAKKADETGFESYGWASTRISESHRNPVPY